MSAVVIERATAADVSAVRDLLVETWHDTYDTLLGEARVTEITDEWHSVEALSRQIGLDGAAFLVARQDGEIVGHLLADGRDPPHLVIRRIYVRPRRQREGIGKQLLEAAMAIFPKTETVKLDVEAENRKGLAFYRREGFDMVGSHVAAGIPHLRMERRLAR